MMKSENFLNVFSLSIISRLGAKGIFLWDLKLNMYEFQIQQL